MRVVAGAPESHASLDAHGCTTQSDIHGRFVYDPVCLSYTRNKCVDAYDNTAKSHYSCHN